MAAPPIYLVDDDGAVRDALSLLLRTVGIEVKTFSDPTSFLEAHKKLVPGCIIMDIRMPMISGLRVQEMLNDAQCDWPIIIISGHGDIDACRRAFKNGAVDFLSKPIDEQDLIDAIQKAQTLQATRHQQTAEVAESRALLESLTEREYEVIDMIVRGWTTKEIAGALSLSPRTVESHRANIAAKLKTTSVAEMTRIVVEGR